MLLSLPKFPLLSRNPNFPIRTLIRARPSAIPLASHAPMASLKVVAEYAKSGRSSCKGCGKAIVAGSLRLGLSSKDPRGFDLVKWHHLDCFSAGSQPLGAAEEINGFSSLKNNDQEALKNIEAAALANQSDKGIHKRDEDKGINDIEKKNTKKAKVHNRDDAGSKDHEEKSKEEIEFSELGEKESSEIDFSTSDIRDNYKDATLAPKWKAFKTIIFREPDDGLHDSEKIAAFDFDGCLANTSVRRVGPDAWSLLYPSIPAKLQELYNSGYKLVFISCGLGKSKDQTDDPFRKPKPGMWRMLEAHFNSGIGIDMDQSFYVGDAAGRVNDHSDADIKFAQGIGLKFHVPEEFFSV